MNQKRARSSSLFLMELILSILFFSIASAICVQFFVKSHMMNKQAKMLDNAVNVCSSIGELVSASDSREDLFELVMSTYPGSISDEDTIAVFLDEDYNSCAIEDAFLTILAEISEKDGMLTASMTSYSPDEPDGVVYELEAKHYIKEVAHE